MSSKKSLELNSSSIEWFVRKLSCLACFAFFACEEFSFLSFSSSKEINSSSSSNLSTINFKNQSITASSWSTSNRMIDRDFVLILWRWSCFHQSRNHLFENVLRRWARFKSTIALNTIWLIDKISCLSNDRIKSSRAFISWFYNILLCSSFFASESRWMKALNDLAFTLNILAATALLSVRFSLKNFFAFFISTMMMMKMRFILTRKRSFEKRIDNQSKNQITAIITITNEISEDLCDRIFIKWVIWVNFSQISDDFQWWWW